jgi:hypothetical protein
MADPVPAVGDLFLALPTYNGDRSNASALVAAIRNPGPFRNVHLEDEGSSFLAWTFNRMWAKALNSRRSGVTHFLMLHADVYPHSKTWVADLYGIMERLQAEVVSLILPMKDARGLTTTALDEGDGRVRRLTLREVEARDPSFTDPALLVNTGMVLVDLRRPWVESVYFDVSSCLSMNESGEYFAVCESEDWFFSRQARAAGIALWATRELRATHYGRCPYPNFGGWGRLDTDDWS